MPTNLSSNQRLSGFLVTGTGTNAGVTVTASGTTKHVLVVKHVSASGDAAGLVTIESPNNTVLWQKHFPAAAWVLSENFEDDMIVGASGALIEVKVNSSTTTCQANLAGYSKLG